MRLINSCVGSPTYQLSSYLASLLKHLYSDSEYSIMNAKEFTDFVSVLKIDPKEVTVSFDVVSVFTSVPVPLAMDVVKRKHPETDQWKSRTSLTSAQILEFFQLIVNNSYYKHEGDYYHQILGCGIGSHVSSVIAELVMQEIESIALATSPVPVRWWCLYVDDSNVCLRRTDVQDFHDHLNTINQNIQFTVDLPFDAGEHQTIAFLDTICMMLGDGQIEVGVHRKATYTDKYLTFDSHSPLQSKSERVKRIICSAGIRVAYKSVMVLADMFRKPKDRPTKVETKGIVYKVKCKCCSFTYIGGSKRSWNSRWAEHKPGVRRKNESAVKDHVERTGHDINSNDVESLEKGVTSYCGRIFLES